MRSQEIEQAAGRDAFGGDGERIGTAPTEGAMTASEERVHVGKQRRESGRARLVDVEAHTRGEN